MTGFSSWLLQNSISVAVTLLIVGLVCRLFHRLPANLRCWLWRLACIKCLLTLCLPLAILLPILPPTTPGAVPVSSSPAPSLPVAPPLVAPTDPLPPVNTAAVHDAPRSSFDADFWLAGFYGIGVLFFSIRLVVAGYQTWRLVHQATAVSHPALPDLSRRFGEKSPPPLARTAQIISPMVAFGTILLPNETGADESLLLAHELAHLRRRDLFWEWFGAILQTIFWFHPLVWLARRQERLACEQAADALVLSVCGASPADYAHLLLAFSLRRSGRSPMLSVGAVERGSRLRLRLQALQQPGLSRRRLLTMGAFALLIATVSLLPWRAVARKGVEAIKTASPTESEEGAILSGTITNGQGKPVARAQVSWVVPYNPKPSVIAETQTDTNGRFVFTDAPTPGQPGESLKDHWRRNLDGWVMIKAEGYGLGVKRVRFDNRNVTILLTPPHTYAAVVRDAQGRPVAGVPIWAEALNNGHNFFRLKWLGYSGKTNSQGEFKAEGLPAQDSVWFRLSPEHWSILEQKTEGDTTTFRIGPGYVLEGVVHYPNGRPVRNVGIQLNAQSGTPFYNDGYVTSDDQGRYRLSGLAVGSYLLRAFAQSNPGMTGPQPEIIHITQGATTIRKNIVIVRAATITGRITDTTGKPFSGVWVSSGPNYTTTDQNGRYSLDVPPGEAVITVEGQEARRIFARRDARNTLDLTFPRAAIVRLQGTVKDSKGEPVPGVFISIQGKQMASGTTSDSLGRFSWNWGRPVSGPLRLFVHKGEEVAFATIEPGKEESIELQMSRANASQIRGQVVDAQGKPISGVPIEVRTGLLTEADYKPHVDSDGHFTIPAMPDMPYVLQFEADGYGAQSIPTPFENKTARKRLTLRVGETRDVGRIVLNRGMDTATGRYIYRGKPLANAMVILITPSGQWNTKTDTQGAFTFPHVIKGESGTLLCASPQYWKKVIVGDLGTIGFTDSNVPSPK